ncbi:MAG TPA: histidine phosphatase family protein [Candidatus Angelobacter sp.]|jgi:alpha-ribazole phosphatase/probable phosphoglycerate mutase|nr:histidine phosphatase family protein [Candidatus Angelobacter sp.]
MKTLLLIRHAHTEMAGRFCGHSDPELSNAGRQQLPEIVTRLQKWQLSAIFASDLKRAVQTAEPVALGCNLPVQLRTSLREINFGMWEGHSWEEIEAVDPAFASSWLKEYPYKAPPGGEAFRDFENRVRNELAELAGLIDRNMVAAAVTHAGFIRTALSLISETPIASIAAADYGSVTELKLVRQEWSVKSLL